MIGDVIAGRYELIALVGTGGMSSVYKAHDRLLERNVALKVLHAHFGDDEEYVERFRREARTVAQLSHPNIVTLIDRGEADGHQFIVFELIDGENLKELVGRTGPLTIRRAIELGLAIADGLAFAHAHGLVHRDVKPQNVLLNGEGEAKVTDFGIARSLDVERGVTQTGTVLGTSNYLSPEQASGKQVTTATDVYSLGVVLFELLTAELPFPGDNFVAVAMRQLNEPVPDLLERRQDIPIRLAGVVEHAMEKDPAHRFATMDELAAELRLCLDELGTFDTESTFIAPGSALREKRASHRVRARGKRSRVPLTIVLVLLAAAAVVAGVLVLGGSPGTKAPPGSVAGAAVALRAVGSYDPTSDGGDGAEHDTGPHSIADATDRNAATYWTTDRYDSPSFGGLKPGVGLVVDAGATRALKQITLSSDTPGFTAKILAGSSPSGGFSADSSAQTVNGTTRFTLDGHPARYYVVWLTSLPAGNTAHVNEVTAS